jgi:hypothetical protein
MDYYGKGSINNDNNTTKLLPIISARSEEKDKYTY